MRVWQFAIHDMQIRTANAAYADLNTDLARTRLAIVKACPFQGNANDD